MAGQIESRNQFEELKKVFRIYDDDDSGLVTARNLYNSADDLAETVSKEEIEMMIDMGDKHKNGGVNHDDFITLMKEVGLLPKDKET